MTVGIVGLGLIGGSLARAFRRAEEICVLGADRDKLVVDFACLSGVLSGKLTEDSLGDCTLILLATYPGGVLPWLREHGGALAPDCLVMDCAGVKEEICREAFPLAREMGFTFVGGHPMAGTQFSGFRHSRADLFDGQPLVVTPPDGGDIRLLARIQELLAPVGFGKIAVTTPAEHDRKIAYTSQLAHLVSSAYIKSPTARGHSGFSAGSYRDLTRVARLHPPMWRELFLANRAPLLDELKTLLRELARYEKALTEEDGEMLEALLREGSERKREVDGL